MRVAALTRVTRLAILFGLAAAAVAISERVGLQQQWEDGVVYTVALFTVLITVLRPAWSRLHFWRNLALLFVLHVAGTVFVLSTVPLGKYGVPKLVWSIALMVEGLMLATVLWKRAASSKPMGKE
jgi:ABC-type uncharacterized transport system permease subunit